MRDHPHILWVNSGALINSTISESHKIKGAVNHVHNESINLSGNKEFSMGSPGILHGMKTYVLQDKYGRINPVHSISAGLDYPGVGPEHSYLFDTKRVTYAAVTDDEAIEALLLLTQKEGIIPAIESAHAVAYLKKLCPVLKEKKNIVVNISGRGDKDMHTVFSILKGGEIHE